MRATHLLLGCVLCFGVSATAVAANTGTAHSTDSSACPTADGGSSSHGSGHDGSASGDVVSISRSNAASAHAAHSSSSPDEGSIRIGEDGGSSGDSAHSSNLGWQSLLPGSIQ